MKKLFELHQKLTLFVNEYRVLQDAPNGKQKLIGYAKQKRLALRERFSLFADETQSRVLASSQARSVMDIAPTFDVTDAEGKPLAVLKKEFKKSLLTSTWTIYEPAMQKALFGLTEKDVVIAVFRRIWNFIPFVGEFPFPLKFHFNILADGQVVGEYVKTTYLRDRYALYLEENQLNRLDERVWMIMAVLLDATQSR